MRLRLQVATVDQAVAIVSLRKAVAENLTLRYGEGHWSRSGTEKGVLFDMRHSRVYVVANRNKLIASLTLGTKKPWAIDQKYFSPCQRAIYLVGMAVDPARQLTGIGRLCLDEVKRIVREWPGDAIRLDAYDAAAGAGEFYRECGFREVGRVVYRNTPLIYFETLL